MSNRLSEDLREGHRRVASDPANRAGMLRLRDANGPAASDPDQRLAEVIVAYRCGPRALWAPVLLDLLAPGMVARLKCLRAEPPAVDEDDLRQQLVLEVLRAAACIPLPVNPAWQKKQILSRANQAVRRWLEREHHQQIRQRSFEAMEEKVR
jgi:hypothetical protein